MKLSAAAKELLRDMIGELGHKPAVDEAHEWCAKYKVSPILRSKVVGLVIHQ